MSHEPVSGPDREARPPDPVSGPEREASPHDEAPDAPPAHDSTRPHTPLRSSVAVSPKVGAASDVGLRHEVNQDAYRVNLVPGSSTAVLAIADGVSASLDSDIASQLAAETAAHLVTDYLVEHPDADSAALAPVLAKAFVQANEAVMRGIPASAASGSSTLIVGVCGPHAVTVASVGDSRAYWVADEGTPERLSVDDSLVQEWTAMGLEAEAAAQNVNVHAITRWLGPDTPDVTPRVLGLQPSAPGWLLVCSDGLWNYVGGLLALGELTRRAAQATTAEGTCQRLVEWALAQGGRDNVTVAVARWEPAS